ncbi:permease-like cell division protein FtsX [uncultured Dialister sp.]|jgi:cell division transport system permease protein|uniref:permease-like cell division protein FtsX n=1 Tax=Dialister succinatiphilus TaxID=487173 RepID=UPI00258A3A7F|nr:permease-like cell division protein FtsX [uncultured Dialister sp.]
MFSSLGYFWKETFYSLFRNKFMAVASVLTVTLSMFILGVFLCAVLNINHMATYLENQVEMTVYLKDGLNTEQVMAVGKKLKALPDLKEIKFTNKDQAMAEFKQRLGDQQGILDAINGNPLPSSYSTSFATPASLKNAVSIVTQYPEVDSVQYGQDIIEQLYKVAQVIRIGGIILIVFLAGAELFIISNTIRLTVFARRREIQIMKYVGATNGFIRWPFIFEGMIIGFIGSGLSSFILWEGYKVVLMEMAQAGLVFIPMIPLWPFIGYMTVMLLAAGIIIGILGSTISLRKYMKV